MSNPTSSFGWQMPTASDLVTDLPADFETFGQAVDTTLADLKGGTTGQVLSKASNTDMDFTWVAQDDSNAIQNAIVTTKGDLIVATGNATLTRQPVGTNGQVLTADSTQADGVIWATPAAAGMANPMTTTGDTIYSSSGSTPARLGIGSSGQVLTVSGGVPSWATPSSGGMTLLSTTSLSGATTTISSISGSYNSLFAVVTGVTNATANGRFRVAPNGTTNITGVVTCLGGTTALSNASYLYLSQAQLNQNVLNRTNSGNVFTFTINNYTSTTHPKTVHVLSGYIDDNDNPRYGSLFGFINTTSAITSLVFSNDGGNLSTGTVLLYGVK